MKKSFLILGSIIIGLVPLELPVQGYVRVTTPSYISQFHEGIKSLGGYFSTLPATLLQDLLSDDPHRSQTASVRYSAGDVIPQAEREFVEQRLDKVHEGLQKFLGTSVSRSRTPSIALAFSGGGFRAMMTTLGFLKGAQDIGLLDSTLYMAGLSGSTWAIAPWVASERPIAQQLTEISEQLAQGIQPLEHSYLVGSVMALFITKLLYGQSINVIDIYGALLANILLTNFGQDRLRVTLSDTHQKSIAGGRLPMPIYTAVDTTVRPYPWFEVTPFEVGSSFVKSYIPVWSLGRTFSNGKSTNYAPEQTLGYFMGIFGSAFAATLRDVIEHSSDVIDMVMDYEPAIFDEYFGKSSTYQFLRGVLKALMPTLLKNFFEQWKEYVEQIPWSKELYDVRLLTDWQPNFTYQLPPTPLADQELINLIDAGYDFNIPIPPLLRPSRDIDVIIVYDSSSNVGGNPTAPALRSAEAYAKANNHKFPPINYAGIEKRSISVFRDKTDAQTPMVIYMPFIANKNYSATFNPQECMKQSYCNTTNFEYTSSQAEELAGLVEFTVKQNADVIRKAIQEKMAQSSRF